MAADPIPAQITQACQDVRHATPADAVSGVQPMLVAAPASTQEASDLLRAAAELELAVIPRGTGSRMHWGYPPRRCDLVIEMTKMNAVVEHAAGDLVATVQAGVGMDTLAEVLGNAGQRLALDPPVRQLPPDCAAGQQDRPGGTVGGVLSTGVAGPLRLRYGSGRDLLIGITVVRPDGTVAKSGGKVVKNVAGYDLGKLFAGSRGTLGLITQATFRLHPVPVAMAHVSARAGTAADAARLLTAALDAALSPVAAEIHWPGAGDPVEIAVAIEGDPDGVAQRASVLSGLLDGGTPHEDADLRPPPWWGQGPLAQADGTVIQVAFWPGELASVLTQIRAAAQQSGLDPVVGGSAAAGVLQASLPPDRDPGAICAFVDELRGRVGSPDGADQARSASGEGPPARTSVVVLHAPPAVGALVDLFGPVPGLPLMRAVKHQFDPAGLMSPGRFAGRI